MASFLRRIVRSRHTITPLTIFICLFFLVQAAASRKVQANEYSVTSLAPVAVSENGKYLLDAQGYPYLFYADTAWTLHHRLAREEIELYLDDRQQKGFNVILFRIPLIELEGEPQHTNHYGNTPFIDKDITQPNEEFFELVDFSLDEMEKRGMTAGFLPLWGFVFNGSYGFDVSDEDVAVYAQWLGNRYKDRKNIIWISGGDTGSNPIWATLGRNLKLADPSKLVTFHPSRWVGSSYHLFGDADWLDFHMIQTGHAADLPTTYETIEYVYNNSSKPIINGEPAYEDIVWIIPDQPNRKIPPYQVRKAIYWSLMAGGFGPSYGHVEIFQFAGAMPDQPYTYGADSYWMDSLDAPAVNQISQLAAFLRTIPWHTFVPDQSLIASDNPIGSTHIRASSGAEQTKALVYFPNQNAASLNLSGLAGVISNASWLDPRTGESQPAELLPVGDFFTVNAPFVEDSLLILDTEADTAPTASPGPSTATATAVPPTPTPTETTPDSCSPKPGELLANGDFEDGKESWHFSTAGKGYFNVATPAYSCDLTSRIHIKVTGKNSQLYQYSVPLKASTTYRLSFAAYATSGGDLTAELLKHTTPYTNYGLSQRFDLGTSWQLYETEFTTSGFSSPVGDGRLRFLLHASNNETFWIDSVSLIEVQDGSITATPSPTNTTEPTSTQTPIPATETPTATLTPLPTATQTPTAEAETATQTPSPSPTTTSTTAPTATPSYTPTATATESSGSPCSPQPGEVLTNGHFEEGTSSWYFSTGGTGSLSTASPAYTCDWAGLVRIRLRGTNMQLYQFNVPLKAETNYKLEFAAYSASGNDLTAELIKHTTPYTNYGLVQRADLGSGWKFYTMEFTTTGFTGSVTDGRVRFRLYGKNNDTYWIDSVSLREET